jgi:hypothetical protein
MAAAHSLPAARGSGWLHAFVPRVPHDEAVLARWRSRLSAAASGRAQAWGESAGIERALDYARE